MWAAGGRDLLAHRTAWADLVVSDAEIAWHGATSAGRRRGVISYCVTKKTWVNEHPEWGEIAGIEILPRPGNTRRSLLVVPISME